MALGTEVGLSPGHIVLDGDTAPIPKGGRAPNFRPMSIVAKTAGWIKMTLGTKVGLGPGHIVLDGDPAPPPQKGGTAPNFRSMSITPKQLDASKYHLVRR